MPNGLDGVLLLGGDANRVGGTNLNEGNVIAFNFSNGVHVARGVQNRVLGNSIFSNAFYGLRLGTSEVYAVEQDGLPNRNQRPPLLTNVFRGSTHVYGTLQSGPSQEYLIECFATAASHWLGFGEGQVLLGRTTVATDASGTAPVILVFPQTLPLGVPVAMTATDTNGNTSAFSYPFAITAAPDGDGDGIPDFYLSIYTNLNPAVTNDYDGDGQTDLEEYLAGTNPENGDEFLRVEFGSLEIPYTSAGRVYTIERTTNLLLGEIGWQFQAEALGTGGRLEFTPDTNAPAAAFRAKAGFP